MSRKHRPRPKRRPQAAHLENIYLENADHEYTDLENAELESTDLGNADFENADLEDVICELIEKLRSFIFAQWVKENLKEPKTSIGTGTAEGVAAFLRCLHCLIFL